ncbi:MAG: hypothetical protein QOG21_1771 [Actinomycetota bacterium]|nr:hypothetical protein [Actinomycetota bacterium]
MNTKIRYFPGRTFGISKCTVNLHRSICPSVARRTTGPGLSGGAFATSLEETFVFHHTSIFDAGANLPFSSRPVGPDSSTWVPGGPLVGRMGVLSVMSLGCVRRQCGTLGSAADTEAFVEPDTLGVGDDPVLVVELLLTEPPHAGASSARDMTTASLSLDTTPLADRRPGGGLSN